jgi:hypothetical protein
MPAPAAPGRVWVDVRDSAGVEARARALAAAYGLRVAHVVEEQRSFSAWVAPAALAALRCDPAVRGVAYEGLDTLAGGAGRRARAQRGAAAGGASRHQVVRPSAPFSPRLPVGRTFEAPQLSWGVR